MDVNDILKKEKYGLGDLVSVMELLRSEKGCPWDREQTHESIRKNFIEETYEVAEAIDAGSSEMLKEELGDVLLQVVFHAQIEKDRGGFGIDDVADGIVRKLIFRHPHIFGDDEVGSAEEMLGKWEEVKKIEKNYKNVSDTLKSVPISLPALMRAEKLYGRTEKGGYGYENEQEAFAALLRSSKDLENAEEKEEAFGELLFNVCAYAKKAGIDAEEALGKYCRKYTEDFFCFESALGSKDEKTLNFLNNAKKSAKNF